MLERFRKAKEAEISALRDLAARNALPLPSKGERPSFSGAIQAAPSIAIIAEYKRASPSRGIIREDLSPREVAHQYANGGASCLSILTEANFFQGKLDYIEEAAFAGLPILRKDFIYDELQVLATAASSASALLLVVRCLPDVRHLRALREKAESFGLEAVVEVFDAHDLALARESGAKIIQVNARDLSKLEVDKNACNKLIAGHPPLDGELWIAASGLETREELLASQAAGFSAALIGTALMRAQEPGQALASLLGRKKP